MYKAETALDGVNAREETICRCSDLYADLLTQKSEFYEHHAALNNALETDRIIVSENWVFRDSDYHLLASPLQVTVIASMAVVEEMKFTALAGLVESSVLVTMFVSMGALPSKTMVALFVMTVPSGRPALGLTEKAT